MVFIHRRMVFILRRAVFILRRMVVILRRNRLKADLMKLARFEGFNINTGLYILVGSGAFSFSLVKLHHLPHLEEIEKFRIELNVNLIRSGVEDLIDLDRLKRERSLASIVEKLQRL